MYVQLRTWAATISFILILWEYLNPILTPHH